MTETTADLPPLTTDGLDVTLPPTLRDDDSSTILPEIQLDAPVVVQWAGNDGQTHSLSRPDPPRLLVRCLARLDASSSTAFFRLRIPLVFKRPAAEVTKTKAKQPRLDAYVFIPPEHILELAHDNSNPANITLDDEVLCLRFVFNKPANLIVPDIDLVPSARSETLLATLRSLAQQTMLALYIPRSYLAENQCLSLCTAISNKSLTSDPRIADISTLYGGKGGKVVEPEMKTQVGIPPSYDELELGPPPFPAKTSKALKRSRQSSPHGHDDDDDDDDDAVCRKRAAALGAVVSALSKRVEVQNEEISNLRQQLRDEAGAHQRMMEDYELRMSVFRREMFDVELRLMRRLDWLLPRPSTTDNT